MTDCAEILIQPTLVEVGIEPSIVEVEIVAGGPQGPAGATGPAGPPGPPGSPGDGARVTYAIPVESPNGALSLFTTPSAYIPNSLVATLNGLVEPITEMSNTQFMFLDPPLVGDTIYLDYLS